MAKPPPKPNKVDGRSSFYSASSDKRILINHGESLKVASACPVEISAEDLRRLDAFVAWMAPKKVPTPMPLHASPEDVNRVRQIYNALWRTEAPPKSTQAQNVRSQSLPKHFAARPVPPNPTTAQQAGQPRRTSGQRIHPCAPIATMAQRAAAAETWSQRHRQFLDRLHLKFEIPGL